MNSNNNSQSDAILDRIMDEEEADVQAARHLLLTEHFSAAAYHAEQVAARLHVAAWCAKDIHDDPHPRRVFDALQRTASALGYDLVRKSDEVAA